MRLIDADALKAEMPTVEDEYKYAHKLIDDAQTVEAVPVSWIEETMQLAEKVGAKEYAEHLEVLLADWAEEREEE